MLGLAKLANFANFWRARSRLYQNKSLQENMRLTAFFKLYKICILLHNCNLNFLAKNRFEKTAIFMKIRQIFANFYKFLEGSFSAVSKRNFAGKYAFDSIFQDLQDLHTFAPLQSQNFSKKSV